MKQITTTTTRSKSASHNGQRDGDIKKKFEAVLTWTQYHRATVIVEAASLEEAKRMANAIGSDEVDDWDAFDGQVDVLEVDAVEGDEEHD